MLTPLVALILCCVDPSINTLPNATNEKPWVVRVANPVFLTWSVGLRGGTVTTSIENGVTTVSHEGAQEHFAQASCLLDSSLANAREEAIPSLPHLALVVTEMPGQTLATFSVRGLANPGIRPARGEATTFVEFWMPPAHEIGGIQETVPSFGIFSTRSGVATLNFCAINTPKHPAPPWHLGKSTVSPVPGVTVTTYFVASGP